MREERTYTIEFRKSGRGNRTSPIQKAMINAMTGQAALELAKKHKALKGMKILAVYVDPKYWSQLHKQKTKARKAPTKRQAKHKSKV